MNRSPFFAFALPCICLFFSCQSAPPATNIEVSPLFSNNMVLQQNAVNTIWGTASPGGRVTVSLNEQVSETVADSAGAWRAFLTPQPYGGPYELRIAGEDTIVLQNVLIGEVWLASGQSNMEWPLRNTNQADQDIPKANYPEIRLLTVEKNTAATPQSGFTSDGWQETTPDQVPSFSAVAYYFGRTLYDSLHIPIGLIHSSWGGTPAEAWTSAQTLKEMPDYKAAVAALETRAAASGGHAGSFQDRQQAWMDAIVANDLGYAGEDPIWAAPDLDDSDWPTATVPQLWEEEALPDYDGIVWFRTSFDAPAGWAGQDLTLQLSQIDDNDITWVNGVEVGQTNLYTVQRTYTIPASAVREGRNVIAVRVTDTGGGGGIWGEAENLKVTPASGSPAAQSLAGAWRYQPAVDLNDTSKLPPRPAPDQNTPTMLYNAMIHPLTPYRIKGAIWYQGESNAGRAYQYRTLFKSMIQDWRTHWDDTIDFHFVQLANFMEGQDEPVEKETWPELREAQTLALELPETGMAVTIDIGETDDIHPRNKHDVGYRLAQAALYTSYGKEVTPSGPMFSEMKVEDGVARLSFEYAESGLLTPGDEPLAGFAVAGADSMFHWAHAEIEDAEILVSHPDVAEPVAVRYGWANNPTVNLFNGEGLPASPFRTDDWPWITEGNH